MNNNVKMINNKEKENKKKERQIIIKKEIKIKRNNKQYKDLKYSMCHSIQKK